MKVSIAGALGSEPVRVYVYSVVGVGVGLLVAYGLVADTLAPLWLALAQAVLAVPAVEGSRALVTSPRTAHQEAQELRELAAAATTPTPARGYLLAVADTRDPLVPPPVG